MDYDQTDIPAAYDRGRDHGPEVLDLWMSAVESHLDGGAITRILDLGCGTGRFSEGLAARFDAEVVGVDPSTKMLVLASAKLRDNRVQYLRGRGEAIPLASQSVDMVFMSMSFHHFVDPVLATQECRRVLCPCGHTFVRTGTREQIDSYPYVPFFPSSRSMLEEVLQDKLQLREVFQSAGFCMVASDVVTQTIAPGWAAYAEKLAAGGDSIVARLRPKELHDGLAALRIHAAVEDDDAVVEPIDLIVFR